MQIILMKPNNRFVLFVFCLIILGLFIKKRSVEINKVPRAC